jgi:hypothetical protein
METIAMINTHRLSIGVCRHPAINRYPCSFPRATQNSKMATTIPEAFKKGTLVSDNEIYVFVKLPISMRVQALRFLSSTTTNIPPPPPSASNSSTNDQLPHTTTFQAFMIDKDEITMMVTTKEYERNKSELVMVSVGGNDGDVEEENDTSQQYEVGDIRYRLITFDVVLAPTLVGFMAVVTEALAAKNVSVLPFAAYSRDHIFVSENDFKTAMDALESLKNDV